MRIAAPVVGLFAVVAALAILAGAPVVLFESDAELSSLPAAPEGTREVAQVTATDRGSDNGPSPAPYANAEPAGNASLPAAGVLPEGTTPAGTPTAGSPSVVGRQPATGGKTAAPDTGNSSGERNQGKDDAKSQGHGKAKGHDKPHGNSGQANAYGHDKSNGQGKANGHQKRSGGVVAFEPPHGQKQGHVGHSGTGKKSGRSGRSHARPRG